MGRSVARQLAEKGASIIIVARNVDRLREAVTYISVRAAFTITSNQAETQHPERRPGFPNPAIPLYQRRSHLPLRVRPRHLRSYCLEQWSPSRYRLVLRRQLIPDTLHRHASHRVAEPNGLQLLHLRLHGLRNTYRVAETCLKRRF